MSFASIEGFPVIKTSQCYSLFTLQGDQSCIHPHQQFFTGNLQGQSLLGPSYSSPILGFVFIYLYSFWLLKNVFKCLVPGIQLFIINYHIIYHQFTAPMLTFSSLPPISTSTPRYVLTCVICHIDSAVEAVFTKIFFSIPHRETKNMSERINCNVGDSENFLFLHCRYCKPFYSHRWIAHIP